MLGQRSSQMKRRILGICLTMLTVFSLAACGDKQETNNNTDWAWTGFGIQEGALTEDGYYYVPASGHVLSYADLSGKGSTILCSKVGCSHEDEDCEAWIQGFSPNVMFFWNDHIYYLDPNTYAICRRNATGTELTQIGIPGGQFLQAQKTISAGRCVQVGQYLYYTANVIDKHMDEESGLPILTSEKRYIGRFHLESGKDEILYENNDLKKNGSLWLLAAEDGGALFIESEGIDLSAEDPQYLETLRQSPVKLFRWDERTGQTQELFNKRNHDCSEWHLIYDGKLYYNTRGDNKTGTMGNVCTYDLTTGGEEIVYENGHFKHLGGGYAMRRTNEDGWQLIELKTGKVLPKQIDYASPIPCESSKEGVVVYYFASRESTNADGDSETIRETVYSYVTYASLADGWQETDMVTLYTKKLGYS